MMDMKQNITKMFNLGVSNYKISKETGIAQTTIGRFTTGKSKLGNMTLDNAIKLNNYYIKLKGDIKMKTIFNTIEHNYKVNIDGRNATYYETKEDLLNEYKENERDIREFEYKFDVELDKITFPVITFDDENSPTGGILLDSTNDREEIISEAFEYFELLNDGGGIWEFEEYNVFEESIDFLTFEDKERNVIGYVMLNEDVDLIEELNKGVNPIEDRWEDGLGNTISLDGWNLE